MSEYDRITGVKRPLVRGFPAVRYFARLKAIGVNLFKATAVQTPGKGRREPLNQENPCFIVPFWLSKGESEGFEQR